MSLSVCFYLFLFLSLCFSLSLSASLCLLPSPLPSPTQVQRAELEVVPRHRDPRGKRVTASWRWQDPFWILLTSPVSVHTHRWARSHVQLLRLRLAEGPHWRASRQVSGNGCSERTSTSFSSLQTTPGALKKGGRGHLCLRSKQQSSRAGVDLSDSVIYLFILSLVWNTRITHLGILMCIPALLF